MARVTEALPGRGMQSAAAAISFEEEEGTFQTGGVATIAAGHAIHDTYTAFLPPLLPALIARFGLSTAEAGVLNVFMTWPSLLQPFIGHLADRVSLRYFVLLGPAITATMMSLLGRAPSYGVMALFLIVVGLSSAGLHAVGPVMGGRLSGRNLGRGMGFWMVGGELGRALGPLVVVSALAVLRLEGIAWLMIGGWAATGVLYLKLRHIPGRPGSPAAVRPWRQALRAMRPLLVPMAGVVAARSLLASGLTTYLPTFLSREGTSLWLAGASLSVLEVAGIAGVLIGGSLSDRLGRRLVLLASLAGPGLLTFPFLATRGWTQLLLLVLLGFTTLSTTPVIMALVQESFPQNRALANGIYMAITFVIQSTAIVVVGLLADYFGLRTAFLVSAVVALLGAPLVFLLPTHRPQSETASSGS